MVLALGTGWALVKVGLVLAALLAALVLANRKVRARDGSLGRTRVQLSGQHSLHVVEIEGRRILVGIGPSGAPRLLCDLSADPVELEPEPPKPGSGRHVGWDGL